VQIVGCNTLNIYKENRESTINWGDINQTQLNHINAQKKRIYNPKRVIQSPTGSNPVIEPNVKQSKTHQTQSSKSNAGPETKLQKRDV
jgi:hypothetical protein